jgi:hypothetical protein
MEYIIQRLLDNYVIVSSIVDNLNIHDTLNFLNFLDEDNLLTKSTTEMLRRRRCDVLCLLSVLVDDPLKLLTFMLKNDIIIAGQKVLEFMYFIVSDNSESWDFYCNGGTLRVTMDYLHSIGVQWNIGESVLYSHNSINRTTVTTYRKTGVLKRGSMSHTITLTYPEFLLSDPHNMLLSSHTTFDQCFIAGWGVVSMYHTLCNQGYFMVWHFNNTPYAEQTQIHCDSHDTMKILQAEVDSSIVEDLTRYRRLYLSASNGLYMDMVTTDNILTYVNGMVRNISALYHFLEDERGNPIDTYVTSRCICSTDDDKILTEERYKLKGLQSISYAKYLTLHGEHSYECNTLRRRDFGDNISFIYDTAYLFDDNTRFIVREKLLEISLNSWYEGGVIKPIGTCNISLRSMLQEEVSRVKRLVRYGETI